MRGGCTPNLGQFINIGKPVMAKRKVRQVGEVGYSIEHAQIVMTKEEFLDLCKLEC